MQHPLLRFHLGGMVYDKAIEIFGPVKSAQIVKFNDIDKVVGIMGTRGIATSLQTARPSFIIRYREIEERTITRLLAQKPAVILIAVKNCRIGPEAFLGCIIVGIGRSSRPAVTLDTKMIIRPAG